MKNPIRQWIVEVVREANAPLQDRIASLEGTLNAVAALQANASDINAALLADELARLNRTLESFTAESGSVTLSAALAMAAASTIRGTQQ